jgi:hypothetical protein
MVIFFFLILVEHKVDVIIETRKNSQDTHLWQAGISTNNTPTKTRVMLGHAFHLSSNHISNFILNNAGPLKVKSK